VQFVGLAAVTAAAFSGMGGLTNAAELDLPQEIVDRITARIAFQTTFVQFSPKGVVRWSPRTVQLIEFVKAPSPSYPDTYLYAMRYMVSVLSEKESLRVDGTICQVLVVYRDGQYSTPTVVCDPVNLDHASVAS
jgi:hypothetical protein